MPAAYYPRLDDAVTLYLKHSGLTQGEFARKIGLSPSSFGYKLRGKSDFKLSEAKAIADIVGKDLIELTCVVEVRDPLHGNKAVQGVS